MSNKSQDLARRREELVARCRLQRAEVANEFAAFRPPVTLGGAAGFVARHKMTALALAGVVIGLVAYRPKKVLALGTAALSMYKMAQHARH